MTGREQRVREWLEGDGPCPAMARLCVKRAMRQKGDYVESCPGLEKLAKWAVRNSDLVLRWIDRKPNPFKPSESDPEYKWKSYQVRDAYLTEFARRLRRRRLRKPRRRLKR